MNYGIAIFPPREIQDLANSYRKRYDPNYDLIPPHIKLKSAFKLNHRDLDDIVQHLNEVAASSAPFRAEFHKVSTFPTTNVIYFAIKDEQPFIELHKRCNQGILFDEENYDYVPHLTIAQEMSNDEMHDVYGSLRMKKMNLEALIDRFHLLYEMENGMWTVFQTFLLKEPEGSTTS